MRKEEREGGEGGERRGERGIHTSALVLACLRDSSKTVLQEVLNSYFHWVDENIEKKELRPVQNIFLPSSPLFNSSFGDNSSENEYGETYSENDFEDEPPVLGRAAIAE
jgi:hypothetical protein